MGRQRGKRGGNANKRPNSTSHIRPSTRAGPFAAAASSSPIIRPLQAPRATESSSPSVAAGSASTAIIRPNPRATQRSTDGHSKTSRYPLSSSNPKVGTPSGPAPEQDAQSRGPVVTSDSVAKRHQVSQPITADLQVAERVDIPETDSPAQTQRGKKRRASNDHPNEPQAKAPKPAEPDAVSNPPTAYRRSASRAATNTPTTVPSPPRRGATDPSTIRNLNPSPGTIIQVRVVEHQKDNQLAPAFCSDVPDDQTYFAIGNERFCSKWRFHLVTKVLPDGVRCAPMFTHNSLGLRNKSRKLKQGYASVRDIRAFPSTVAFEGEGRRKPLETEEMYGTWQLRAMAAVKLGFVEWGHEKPAYEVGRISMTEMRRLRRMLETYPPDD